MDVIDEETRSGTVDEQLGSPGFSFEMGWLSGVVLGTLVIVTVIRHRAHRRHGAVDI